MQPGLKGLRGRGLRPRGTLVAGEDDSKSPSTMSTPFEKQDGMRISRAWTCTTSTRAVSLLTPALYLTSALRSSRLGQCHSVVALDESTLLYEIELVEDLVCSENTFCRFRHSVQPDKADCFALVGRYAG
jgi:hypothetical protein